MVVLGIGGIVDSWVLRGMADHLASVGSQKESAAGLRSMQVDESLAAKLKKSFWSPNPAPSAAVNQPPARESASPPAALKPPKSNPNVSVPLTAAAKPSEPSTPASPVPSKRTDSPLLESGSVRSFPVEVTIPHLKPSFEAAAVPIVKQLIPPDNKLQEAIAEKSAAQAEITRLSNMLAASMQEVQTMRQTTSRISSSINDQSGELQRARDQIAALKRDLAATQTDLFSIKKLSDVQALSVVRLEKELIASQSACLEARQETDAVHARESIKQREIALMLEEKMRLKANLTEQVDMATAGLKTQWEEKERVFMFEADSLRSERNALSSKLESFRKDLSKMVKAKSNEFDQKAKHWAVEKARFEEEIKRKNLSLDDAMVALATKDPARTGRFVMQMEQQKKIQSAALSDRMIIEQNHAFQSVAQELLETMQDKEIQIENLRKDNALLGQRVLALDSGNQLLP